MLTTKLVMALGTALALPPSLPASFPPSPAPHAAVVAQAWHVGPPAPRAWRGQPPPPAFEEVRPRRGYVWVEGGFEWRHGRYVRLPGHWERERMGRRWQPGRWEVAGDHYVWVRGAWIEVGPIGIEIGNPMRPPLPNQPLPPPPPPMPAQPMPPPPPPRSHGRISISGQILDQYRRPVPGVAVVLAGTAEGTAVTDGYGHYVFAGLVPGSYAVRPNDQRCGFGPDVMNLNNLYASAIQNFGANCR
jgi:hypothetical protein